MLLRRGWQQIFEVARKSKIIKEIGQLIKKKPNAIYKPEQTMKTLFKGFLQNIRIYHFSVKRSEGKY